MTALGVQPETSTRVVHVRRGQVVTINAGVGVELEVERFASGAVRLRNAKTGRTLRCWTPKEARER